MRLRRSGSCSSCSDHEHRRLFLPMKTIQQMF